MTKRKRRLFSDELNEEAVKIITNSGTVLTKQPGIWVYECNASRIEAPQKRE